MGENTKTDLMRKVSNEMDEYYRIHEVESDKCTELEFGEWLGMLKVLNIIADYEF